MVPDPRSLLVARGRPRAPWRLLGHAVLLAILGLGLFLVAGGAAPSLTSSPVAATLLSGVAVAASVAVGARWLDRRPLADLGVRGPAADLVAGVALGGGAMAGVFVTGLAAGWVRVVDVAASPPGVSFPVALLGGVVLMGAVGVYEELLVRGYWLTNLAEGLRWVPRVDARRAVALSVAVTSLAFGVMHAPNPNASPTSALTITVAGVLLGLGYALTESLALPVGFHAAWNFAQSFVFGFPTSGLEFATAVLAVDVTGPPGLTGGRFGPEGGAVGLAWLLVALAAMLWWIRRTRGELAVRTAVAEPVRRDGTGGRPESDGTRQGTGNGSAGRSDG